MARSAGIDGGYEALIVDDGSTDVSLEYVERWIQEDGNVLLLKLSRNFGMEIAMSAGAPPRARRVRRTHAC